MRGKVCLRVWSHACVKYLVRCNSMRSTGNSSYVEEVLKSLIAAHLICSRKCLVRLIFTPRMGTRSPIIMNNSTIPERSHYQALVVTTLPSHVHVLNMCMSCVMPAIAMETLRHWKFSMK